jgi:hypothetical protein
MRRVGMVAVGLVLGLTTTTAQVDLQHGRLETRPESTPAAALEALSRDAAPVWIAWQVPMIAGQASPCSSWVDEANAYRGERLGPAPNSPPSPSGATPRQVRLDAGTRVTVLVRALGGRVERLRVAGDDCPIDAGNQPVHFLGQVTPTASVTYLDALVHAPTSALADTRRIADAALTTLSYHADAAATAALDRLVLPASDMRLRRAASRALARTRGQHGVDRVLALITGESHAPTRQAFVSALAESPMPTATAALLTIAERDTEPAVRGEAAYWHIRRAGIAGVPVARRLLDAERDDTAARRIVSGLAAAPRDVAVPALLELARSSARLSVRKEAIQALGRTGDPQAMRFLEDIVARQ